MSTTTAVVHLVRQANGLAPFEDFLASYREHDAAHAHELVLLFKGFATAAELDPYRRRADGLVAHELHVSDEGMDLHAYLAAARQLTQRRLCFLNSYTTLLAPGWLDLLARALDRPRAGIAGASGSWGSHRSFALWLLRLPNGYRSSLGDRAAMHVALSGATPPDPGPRRGLLSRVAGTALGLGGEIAGHRGFPAPHVRTNAFLIERELLLSLRAGTLVTKAANYRFEAGRRGLSEQLRERGLGLLTVGRDGESLPADSWPEGELYWQGRQRNLLAADNQTRAYERASQAEREALARYAWGPRARAT